MGFTYKFSTDEHHYYMGPDMRMVKVPHTVPDGRSDEVLREHGKDAEDDPAVRDYFTGLDETNK